MAEAFIFDWPHRLIHTGFHYIGWQNVSPLAVLRRWLFRERAAEASPPAAYFAPLHFAAVNMSPLPYDNIISVDYWHKIVISATVSFHCCWYYVSHTDTTILSLRLIIRPPSQPYIISRYHKVTLNDNGHCTPLITVIGQFRNRYWAFKWR